MATRKPPAKKTTTKKLAQAAAWRPRWALLILVVVLGAFALVLTAAAVLHAIRDDLKPMGAVINTRVAEISPEQIEDNAVVETRDDSYIEGLRTFLSAEAAQDLRHKTCKAAHYVVTHATSDGQQLKVAYGCGEAPTGSAFVVHQDDAWKFLSPTNQFDQFDIPTCEHIGMYNISTEIAPICWNRTDTGPSYMVR